MILSELIQHLQVIETTGRTDFDIQTIQYDSRKCTPGSLFVAISGTHSDGHKFIKNAISNGAIAVIGEDSNCMNQINPSISFISVLNSRQALSRIAHVFYGEPTRKLKVIGVTGTNGKTTVTYLIRNMLDYCGFKTGLIGTTGIISGSKFLESTHTTPESLELAQIFSQMLEDGIDYVVMEASSHALHQGRTDNINFIAAVFTNLTHEHLDYHQTMQNYAEAKQILFNNLAGDAIAVVNGDDDFTEIIISSCNAEKILKVGTNSYNQIRVMDQKISLKGTEFTLDYLGSQFKIRSGLLGKFNIQNLSLAASFGLAFGLPAEKVIMGLSTASTVPGRMERIDLRNGAIGLVDYSHTPDALQKALFTCREAIREGREVGRLICVFGCGGDRDKSKRSIMGQISSTLADITVICDDNPRTEDPDEIIKMILTGISNEQLHKIEVIRNRAKAIQHAVKISKLGDLILVAGKGHEKYQIIGTTRSHFDDKEELKKY